MALPTQFFRWLWLHLRLAGRTVWRALMHFIDDDGTTLAGHIAYTALFALFPFLIFLTTLAGEFGQDEAASEFIHVVLRVLPPEVAEVIQPAIEEVVSVLVPGGMPGRWRRR